MKDYCELLKMRYPDSFFIHFSDMQENEQDRIIPLSLQLLTENAIKHNLHTPKEPLTISYYRDRDYLVVRNNYHPIKRQSGLSTGFGLAGLDKRYRLQCNQCIVVNRTEHDFEVKLPIIPA